MKKRIATIIFAVSLIIVSGAMLHAQNMKNVHDFESTRFGMTKDEVVAHMERTSSIAYVGTTRVDCFSLFNQIPILTFFTFKEDKLVKKEYIFVANYGSFRRGFRGTHTYVITWCEKRYGKGRVVHGVLRERERTYRVWQTGGVHVTLVPYEERGELVITVTPVATNR